MTQQEELTKTFQIPETALQQAMSEQPTAPLPQAIETDPDPPSIPEQSDATKLRYALGKTAAGLALLGCFWFSGEQKAEANPQQPGGTINQTSPQESNWWNTYGVPLSAVAGVAATVFIGQRNMTRQRRDNSDTRFGNISQAVKGDTSGILELSDLSPYAEDRVQAPKVFAKVAAYLRHRRTFIAKLRKTHEEGTTEFEDALEETRNHHREALKILVNTLPIMRKQLRGDGITGKLKRLARLDEMKNLERMTGIISADGKPRLDLQGINLDYLRNSVKNCSFRDTDLTGAGMRCNQISGVSFRNARICEAQFMGSTLTGCSLIRTDARAAYWMGATIERCVVDKHTKLGNLPDNHADTKFGSMEPDKRDEYRGHPEVVLKDLIPKGMSKDTMIEMIKDWQRNGLRLLPGSTPEYILD